MDGSIGLLILILFSPLVSYCRHVIHAGQPWFDSLRLLLWWSPNTIEFPVFSKYLNRLFFECIIDPTVYMSWIRPFITFKRIFEFLIWFHIIFDTIFSIQLSNFLLSFLTQFFIHHIFYFRYDLLYARHALNWDVDCRAFDRLILWYLYFMGYWLLRDGVLAGVEELVLWRMIDEFFDSCNFGEYLLLGLFGLTESFPHKLNV